MIFGYPSCCLPEVAGSFTSSTEEFYYLKELGELKGLFYAIEG